MSHRLVCFFGYAQTSRRTARKLPGKAAKRTDFIAEKHRNGPWTGLSRQNAGARPLIDWSPAANDHGNVSERAEGIRLDAIEKAIRNAFEKGNAEDRAFRERVYRSAFAALDRALQANPGVTVEAAIKRRKAVQAKIAEIESEFLPAVPDVGRARSEDAAPRRAKRCAADRRRRAMRPQSSPDRCAPDRRRAIVVDGPAQPPASDAPRSRVLPVVPDIMPDATLPGAPAIDMSDSAPPGAPRRKWRPTAMRGGYAGRRLPLTAIFFGVTLLAAAGIGLLFRRPDRCVQDAGAARHGAARSAADRRR